MNWAKQNRFNVYGPDPNRRLCAARTGPAAQTHPTTLSVWIALAGQLPDVRIDKIVCAQQRLTDETYDVPVALDVALDRAIDELQEQPVFLAPDQN